MLPWRDNELVSKSPVVTRFRQQSGKPAESFGILQAYLTVCFVSISLSASSATPFLVILHPYSISSWMHWTQLLIDDKPESKMWFQLRSKCWTWRKKAEFMKLDFRFAAFCHYQPFQANFPIHLWKQIIVVVARATYRETYSKDNL